MTPNIAPAEIWAEYEQGKSYNQLSDIDLYNTVRQNENFYVGKQWEGVRAPDLDKPVLNILKRVVSYFISTLVSDDVTAQVDYFESAATDDQNEMVLTVINQQFDEIMEMAKVKAKNREAIRDAAVDGDACFYVNYDPDIDNGQLVSGAIEVETVYNTNVIFGNPCTPDVQKQPYIIIVMRRQVKSVRAEAVANGMPEEDAKNIISDADSPDDQHKADRNDAVTVLLKLWKETTQEADEAENLIRKTTVHAIKVTHDAVIKDAWDTGYKLYPVAYMSWDKIKNSYHGQAAITGMVPNQIFINKLFAMSMEHVKNTAFPKILYDKTKIEAWDNRPGTAIGVNGEPTTAISTNTRPAEMSNQVMVMLDKVIQYTKDTMGASDAALGNVKPDNTSAIIAVQKASSAPLELQRMTFYQFVEDYIRIFLDIMRVNYGERYIKITNDDGQDETVLFNFDILNDLHLKLNVEVGASTYWSELMQTQTLDNLFSKGIVTDAITYLENVPDGYVRNKQKIIASLKQKQEAMQQLAAQQAAMEMQGMGGVDGGVLPEMQDGLADQ